MVFGVYHTWIRTARILGIKEIGPAYERWAKVFNLKQMAAALQYLRENGLMEYEQLEQKAVELTDRFHTLSDSIKSTESAMRINAELKAAVVDYAKTHPVFEGYKAAKRV